MIFGVTVVQHFVSFLIVSQSGNTEEHIIPSFLKISLWKLFLNAVGIGADQGAGARRHCRSVSHVPNVHVCQFGIDDEGSWLHRCQVRGIVILAAIYICFIKCLCWLYHEHYFFFLNICQDCIQPFGDEMPLIFGDEMPLMLTVSHPSPLASWYQFYCLVNRDTTEHWTIMKSSWNYDSGKKLRKKTVGH